MFGGTLALLTSALRLETRRWTTHTLRFALVGILLLLLLITTISSLLSDAPGFLFFKQIVYTNYFFITLAGGFFFVSAITEQKESQTLGLLKIAGLNSISILLGTAVPRLVGALLLLGVQYPFVLLSITLGGVLPHQVEAAYLALGAYLVLLASLALLCSVVCRRSTSAAGLLASLVFLPLLLQWGLMISSIRPAPWIDRAIGWVSIASVWRQLGEIMRIGFDDRSLSVPVIAQLVAAGACFLLAWVNFDWFTRQPHTSAPGRPMLRIGWGRRSRSTIGRAWRNPLVWKDFHFLTGGYLGLVIRLGALGLFAVGLAAAALYDQWGWGPYGFSVMGISVVFAMYDGANYASRMFRSELQWQTLSSLMTLPISTARMAYSKLLGGLIAILPALGCFSFSCLVLVWALIDMLTDPENSGGNGPWPVMAIYVVMWVFYGLVGFVLYLYLTVFLSLHIRWGASGLALLAMLVFLIGMFCCGPGSTGLSIGLIVLLNFSIGWRLRTLAAEDNRV